MHRPAAAIDLEDVRLTLESAAGPVNILNGVSLTVEPGETLALLGPSGLGQILAADGGRRAGSADRRAACASPAPN